MGPSDITPAVPRNDGRSVHHRMMLEKQLDSAAAKLAEIKRMVAPFDSCGKDVTETDEIGCA